MLQVMDQSAACDRSFTPPLHSISGLYDRLFTRLIADMRRGMLLLTPARTKVMLCDEVTRMMNWIAATA